MKKIILTWLTTARGGAEKSVSELAHYLSQLDVSIDVVWWRAGGPPFPPGVRVPVHEVDGWDSYRDAVGALAEIAETRIISSHRTAASDVVCAPESVIAAVVRGVVDPELVLRAVDPGTGDLVGYYPHEFPWDTLREVATWVGVSRACAESARGKHSAGLRVSLAVGV